MDLSGSSLPNEEPSEDPDEGGGEQVPRTGNDAFGAVPGSRIPDITDSTLGISDSLLSESLFAELDASFDDFDDTEELETVDGGEPRGWIPPDDRLWLHPSEIGRQARAQELEEIQRSTRRPDRRGLFAAGVVGTAALTAAIAAVALASTSQNPAAMTAVTRLTSHITLAKPANAKMVKPKAQVCSTWMPASICGKVKRVQPSIIQLTVARGDKTVTGTAVVMPIAAETVAVTAASFVGSSLTVEAFTPSGRKEQAQVIGVDSASGIAAIRVPWTMPSAPIVSNIETVSPGTELVFACGSSDGLQPAMGQVDSTDTSTTQLMDTIDVDISADATPGGVLLDSSGKVLGVLGATEDPSKDLTGEFVPSWLAEGVAEQLVDAHKVTHGWLDVAGYTGAMGGAYVKSVTAKGPAAVAGIHQGDTIIGISTVKGIEKIASMADLRGLLYLEPPGARVEIELLSTTGQTSMVMPVLAAVSPSS
jgi:S1-C subfamily serine protease